MRFRVKDLLLLNILAAMYLSACIQALRVMEPRLPAVASISNIANTWAIMIPIAVLVFIAMLELLRRLTLRRVKPIVAELPILITWVSSFLIAAMVLASGFLLPLAIDLPLGAVNGFVIGSAYSIFGIGFFRFLHPYVSVYESGIFYLAWKHPWSKVSILRNSDGAIDKLRCGWKLSGGFVVEVPPELSQAIEAVLPEDQRNVENP